MSDSIKTAQRAASKAAQESERIRHALVAEASRPLTGKKLIEIVATSTSLDASRVQAIYWNLLHSGKLRLDQTKVRAVR